MAKRLRENAPKINWTPEPIRPELLHFFDLPSISSISNSQPTVHSQSQAISFSSSPDPERMPIRTPQPPLEKKNLHQMVITYHRLRKAPAFKQPDPAPDPAPSSGASNLASQLPYKKRNWKDKITISPSQMVPQGTNLKSPRGNPDRSVAEIGSPFSLSLSEKWARRKRSGTLLLPVDVPKRAKRRRMPQARSTQVGWVNTGGAIPWTMAGSQMAYNLRRRKHFSEGDAPTMAVVSSFESVPPTQPGNGERKFSVSLLFNEIEEDFMKMAGEMPLHKLNKRPKKTQSQLDNLFPGMCFITSDKDVLSV